MRDEVLGKCVFWIAGGDQRQMRQRLGRVSIVQQQQTEVVVRAQVFGAFDENLLEEPLRGDGVAFALPM